MINKKDDYKLFKLQYGIIASVIILFTLVALLIVLRKLLEWPEKDSEKTILIGIFIFSLMPFIFYIVDIAIKRGGKFEIGNFKLDFSKVEESKLSKFVVPANIGTRGQAIDETSMITILNTLEQATTNSIAIVDLEDGQAWWETRLLVLLSGAKRLGYPNKIVFVATVSGKEQYFIGWAYPNSLIKSILDDNIKYKQSYLTAKSISLQWNLIEPIPGIQFPQPFPWMQGKAFNKSNLIFDGNTGLPNDLYEEQLLQNELGNEIEKPEGGKPITYGRLIDLFNSFLNENFIDQNDPPEQQIKKLINDDLPYIALTQDGKYLSLVSRFNLYNEILKQLIDE